MVIKGKLRYAQVPAVCILAEYCFGYSVQIRWPTTGTGQDKKTRGEVGHEVILFAGSVYVLLRDFYFCRECFCFAVRLFLLPRVSLVP